MYLGIFSKRAEELSSFEDRFEGRLKSQRGSGRQSRELRIRREYHMIYIVKQMSYF